MIMKSDAIISLKIRSMILMTLGFLAGVASAAEYHVDRDQENLVKFISDAPLEDFEGVTDRIDGYVLWKGEDSLVNADFASSQFYFEVELDGLDTGIGLRNRHMRERYLETKKFPFTHYSGSVLSVKKIEPDTYKISTRGVFYIHNVEKEINIEGTAREIGGDFEVSCAFELKLSDFDIEIPKLMFLKIDEVIKVELDFHLKKVN